MKRRFVLGALSRRRLLRGRRPTSGRRSSARPALPARDAVAAAKSTAEEKEKGHASARVAWESKRDEQIFDFDYVDYEPGWFSTHDSKEMAKELGRGDAEKAFPKPKYKYVRDEPITLQGWDGYALDIEGAAGAGVMMRTYIVKDRLFRMLVTVGRRDQQDRRQPLPRFARSSRRRAQ